MSPRGGEREDYLSKEKVLNKKEIATPFNSPASGYTGADLSRGKLELDEEHRRIKQEAINQQIVNLPPSGFQPLAHNNDG